MRCIFPTLVLFVFLSCSSKAADVKVENIDNRAGEETLNTPTYQQLIQNCATRKAELKKAYIAADDNTYVQDSILVEAQQYLLDISSDFMKAWYFTPWSFNGHSEIPKEGTIACGYFITTTLRDMGFKIPRIKWAQQTSEYLVKQVSTDIKRFYNKPMKDVVEDISARGEGLYIVGLDCHVGYIYSRGGDMLFIHANYYSPRVGVMPQKLIGRNPLNDSKYRVIGKIFEKEMVRNWLLEIVYPA